MNPAAPTAAVPTPADQYATLKAAVLGASANATPGTSVLGPTPELDQLYGGTVGLERSQLRSAAPNGNTDIRARADAQAQADAQAAAAQQLKALQDPSKYQQVQKSDGGYAFYDPLGHEISASQYAAVTNRNPADILKNSQNPIDKAFVQDYNQLQNYINDKSNAASDPKARSAAQAVETKVRQVYGIDLHLQNPSEVIDAFHQAYPTYFGGSVAGRQGTSTLLPDQNARNATIKAAGKSSASRGL